MLYISHFSVRLVYLLHLTNELTFTGLYYPCNFDSNSQEIISKNFECESLFYQRCCWHLTTISCWSQDSSKLWLMLKFKRETFLQLLHPYITGIQYTFFTCKKWNARPINTCRSHVELVTRENFSRLGSQSSLPVI